MPISAENPFPIQLTGIFVIPKRTLYCLTGVIIAALYALTEPPERSTNPVISLRTDSTGFPHALVGRIKVGGKIHSTERIINLSICNISHIIGSHVYTKGRIFQSRIDKTIRMSFM